MLSVTSISQVLSLLCIPRLDICWCTVWISSSCRNRQTDRQTDTITEKTHDPILKVPKPKQEPWRAVNPNVARRPFVLPTSNTPVLERHFTTAASLPVPASPVSPSCCCRGDMCEVSTAVIVLIIPISGGIDVKNRVNPDAHHRTEHKRTRGIMVQFHHNTPGVHNTCSSHS